MPRPPVQGPRPGVVPPQPNPAPAAGVAAPSGPVAPAAPIATTTPTPPNATDQVVRAQTPTAPAAPTRPGNNLFAPNAREIAERRSTLLQALETAIHSSPPPEESVLEQKVLEIAQTLVGATPIEKLQTYLAMIRMVRGHGERVEAALLGVGNIAAQEVYVSRPATHAEQLANLLTRIEYFQETHQGAELQESIRDLRSFREGLRRASRNPEMDRELLQIDLQLAGTAGEDLTAVARDVFQIERSLESQYATPTPESVDDLRRVILAIQALQGRSLGPISTNRREIAGARARAVLTSVIRELCRFDGAGSQERVISDRVAADLEAKLNRALSPQASNEDRAWLQNLSGDSLTQEVMELGMAHMLQQDAGAEMTQFREQLTQAGLTNLPPQIERSLAAATLFRGLGQMARAREALAPAARYFHENFNAQGLLSVGKLEQSLGMSAEAEAHFREIVSMAPNSDESKFAQAFIALAHHDDPTAERILGELANRNIPTARAALDQLRERRSLQRHGQVLGLFGGAVSNYIENRRSAGAPAEEIRELEREYEGVLRAIDGIPTNANMARALSDAVSHTTRIRHFFHDNLTSMASHVWTSIHYLATDHPEPERNAFLVDRAELMLASAQRTEINPNLYAVIQTQIEPLLNDPVVGARARALMDRIPGEMRINALTHTVLGALPGVGLAYSDSRGEAILGQLSWLPMLGALKVANGAVRFYQASRLIPMLRYSVFQRMAGGLVHATTMASVDVLALHHTRQLAYALGGAEGEMTFLPEHYAESVLESIPFFFMAHTAGMAASALQRPLGRMPSMVAGGITGELDRAGRPILNAMGRGVIAAAQSGLTVAGTALMTNRDLSPSDRLTMAILQDAHYRVRHWGANTASAGGLAAEGRAIEQRYENIAENNPDRDSSLRGLGRLMTNIRERMERTAVGREFFRLVDDESGSVDLNGVLGVNPRPATDASCVSDTVERSFWASSGPRVITPGTDVQQFTIVVPPAGRDARTGTATLPVPATATPAEPGAIVLSRQSDNRWQIDTSDPRLAGVDIKYYDPRNPTVAIPLTNQTSIPPGTRLLIGQREIVLRAPEVGSVLTQPRVVQHPEVRQNVGEINLQNRPGLPVFDEGGSPVDLHIETQATRGFDQARPLTVISEPSRDRVTVEFLRARGPGSRDMVRVRYSMPRSRAIAAGILSANGVLNPRPVYLWGGPVRQPSNAPLQAGEVRMTGRSVEGDSPSMLQVSVGNADGTVTTHPEIRIDVAPDVQQVNVPITNANGASAGYMTLVRSGDGWQVVGGGNSDINFTSLESTGGPVERARLVDQNVGSRVISEGRVITIFSNNRRNHISISIHTDRTVASTPRAVNPQVAEGNYRAMPGGAQPAPAGVFDAQGTSYSVRAGDARNPGYQPFLQTPDPNHPHDRIRVSFRNDAGQEVHLTMTPQEARDRGILVSRRVGSQSIPDVLSNQPFSIQASGVTPTRGGGVQMSDFSVGQATFHHIGFGRWIIHNRGSSPVDILRNPHSTARLGASPTRIGSLAAGEMREVAIRSGEESQSFTLRSTDGSGNIKDETVEVGDLEARSTYFPALSVHAHDLPTGVGNYTEVPVIDARTSQAPIEMGPSRVQALVLTPAGPVRIYMANEGRWYLRNEGNQALNYQGVREIGLGSAISLPPGQTQEVSPGLVSFNGGLRVDISPIPGTASARPAQAAPAAPSRSHVSPSVDPLTLPARPQQLAVASGDVATHTILPTTQHFEVVLPGGRRTIRGYMRDGEWYIQNDGSGFLALVQADSAAERDAPLSGNAQSHNAPGSIRPGTARRLSGRFIQISTGSEHLNINLPEVTEAPTQRATAPAGAGRGDGAETMVGAPQIPVEYARPSFPGRGLDISGFEYRREAHPSDPTIVVSQLVAPDGQSIPIYDVSSLRNSGAYHHLGGDNYLVRRSDGSLVVLARGSAVGLYRRDGSEICRADQSAEQIYPISETDLQQGLLIAVPENGGLRWHAVGNFPVGRWNPVERGARPSPPPAPPRTPTPQPTAAPAAPVNPPASSGTLNLPSSTGDVTELSEGVRITRTANGFHITNTSGVKVQVEENYTSTGDAETTDIAHGGAGPFSRNITSITVRGRRYEVPSRASARPVAARASERPSPESIVDVPFTPPQDGQDVQVAPGVFVGRHNSTYTIFNRTGDEIHICEGTSEGMDVPETIPAGRSGSANVMRLAFISIGDRRYVVGQSGARPATPAQPAAARTPTPPAQPAASAQTGVERMIERATRYTEPASGEPIYIGGAGPSDPSATVAVGAMHDRSTASVIRKNRSNAWVISNTDGAEFYSSAGQRISMRAGEIPTEHLRNGFYVVRDGQSVFFRDNPNASAISVSLEPPSPSQEYGHAALARVGVDHASGRQQLWEAMGHTDSPVYRTLDNLLFSTESGTRIQRLRAEVQRRMSARGSYSNYRYVQEAIRGALNDNGYGSIVPYVIPESGSAPAFLTRALTMQLLPDEMPVYQVVQRGGEPASSIQISTPGRESFWFMTPDQALRMAVDRSQAQVVYTYLGNLRNQHIYPTSITNGQIDCHHPQAGQLTHVGTQEH